MNTHKTYYNSIDGLRAFSAIGIALMHIFANGSYHMEGFIFEKVIASLGDLVFLFMMISSFSVCCGYYGKILAGNGILETFYTRRFGKIWPFFAVLTILDLVITPSLSSLYEAFANLTLSFGLLPNHSIEVIGVGWTIGVIFVFYMLFPYFCFLFKNKRRAWLTMLVAAIYHVVCQLYFFDNAHMGNDFSGRTNFVYCAVYFSAGILIYLYAEDIRKIAERWRWLFICTGVVGAALYFLTNASTISMLVLFSSTLMYAIGRSNKKGLLNNKATRFISEISLEIYLSHMVVYRLLEKTDIVVLCGNNIAAYCVVSILVLSGTIIFVFAVKKCLHMFSLFMKDRIKNHD